MQKEIEIAMDKAAHDLVLLGRCLELMVWVQRTEALDSYNNVLQVIPDKIKCDETRACDIIIVKLWADVVCVNSPQQAEPDNILKTLLRM
jgi:hypothetical protein